MQSLKLACWCMIIKQYIKKQQLKGEIIVDPKIKAKVSHYFFDYPNLSQNRKKKLPVFIRATTTHTLWESIYTAFPP